MAKQPLGDVSIVRHVHRITVLFNTTYVVALIVLLLLPLEIRAELGGGRPPDLRDVPVLGFAFSYLVAWLFLGHGRVFLLANALGAFFAAWWWTGFVFFGQAGEPTDHELIVKVIAGCITGLLALLPFIGIGRWVLYARWLLREPLTVGGPTLPQVNAAVRRLTRTETHRGSAAVPVIGRVVVGLASLIIVVGFIQVLLPDPEVFLPVSLDDGDREGVWVGNFLCVPFAVALILLGRRLERPDAEARLAHSVQPPTLLLRSFADDARSVKRRNLWMRWVTYSGRRTLESTLADRIDQVSPFVAIGRPGEELPALGAARDYFSDDDWQQAVRDWMMRSRWVVMIVGKTRWVTWELGQLAAGGYLGKLILFFPPGSTEDKAERWMPAREQLQTTPWAAAVAELDIADVIAMRFAPGGELTVVRAQRFATETDYDIALTTCIYDTLGEPRSDVPWQPRGDDAQDRVRPLARPARALGVRAGIGGSVLLLTLWAASVGLTDPADGGFVSAGVVLLVATAVPFVAGLIALLRHTPSHLPARHVVSVVLQAAIPAAAYAGMTATLALTAGSLLLDAMRNGLPNGVVGLLLGFVSTGNFVLGVFLILSASACAVGVAAVYLVGLIAGRLRD